jgi:hypothetical protein
MEAEVVVEEAVVKVEVKAAEAEVVEVKAEEHLAVEAEAAVVVEEQEVRMMVMTRRRQRERPMSDVLAARHPRKRELEPMPMDVTKERHLFVSEPERRAEVPSAIVEGEVSRDVIDLVKKKPGSHDVRRVEQWTSQST